MTEPNRPRILFVDDDVDVLDGLRMSLRRERRRWEVLFVGSGAEALDLVDREAVDVVVTDMRMPGLDGSELLKSLHHRHPAVVRIVLSGEATAEQTMSSLPHVHRWLPKPCDRDALITTIESALGSTDHRSSAIDDLVGSVVSLPSPPAIYVELMEAFENPELTFDEIGRVIEADPAITAKLLRWGSSPLFGGVRVESVADVLRAVGLTAAAQLVLSVEVLDRMAPEREIEGCHSEALRAHAEMTAQLATHMVRPAEASIARTAGLLHHIGLLVLITRAYEQLLVVVDESRRTGRRLADVQQQILGVNDADVGARLLGLWGLPDAIVLAVRDQHTVSPDPSSPFISSPAAVQVAAQLAGAVLADGDSRQPLFTDRWVEPAAADMSQPLWLTPALASLPAEQLEMLGCTLDRARSAAAGVTAEQTP